MPSVPSQEYWIKRAEDVLVAGEKSELQYEKELTAAYKTTLQEIRKEINAFYTKYADEQEISLATVRKRLSPSQLKDFQTMHNKYLAEAEKYGLDPAYQKYLRNLSGKAYISRLQELSSNIRHQVELLAGRNKNAVETVLQDGFEDSFYRTLFNVQKQAKIGVSFTQPGKEQLEAAVKEKWLESNYSDRIWADKNRLVSQLNQIIPREFVRGRGPVAMGRELAQKMNTSYNNAVRLARTEMNHISNKGTMEAYKKSKVVSEYEYVATLDSRTSDICASMDGKIFKLSEAQSGINMPPLHPHCRSTTIPHFPKDEIGANIIDRIARDENDESYFVGEDVTYEEWTEKYASASYAKKIKKLPETPEPTISKPLTLYDKIYNIKQEIQANGGVIEESHLHKAGKLIMSEIDADLAPAIEMYKALDAEYTAKVVNKRQALMEMQKAGKLTYAEYLEKRKEIDYAIETQELIQKRMEAYKKAYGKETAMTRLKNKLSEIRETGIGKHNLNKDHFEGRSPARKIVEQAYNHYPKEWVDKSVAHNKLRISTVERGYYAHSSQELALSGNGDLNKLVTAFHELGHRFERTVPGISALETKFYKRRTEGEELKWLGAGYSKSEKTRRDHFLSSYMGKYYDGEAYELVSMGFEYAYTYPSRLHQDEDFAEFIYGILALV